MAAFDIQHPRIPASRGESSVGPATSPQGSGAETHAGDSTSTNDQEARPVLVPDDESAPSRWGHLEHLKRIGRGQFGDVYRAWDVQLERKVALKLSRPDGRFQASGSWGGFQEARLLARVRHPGVVTVHGADHREGRFGVWMEYIRGRTLEEILQQQGTLTPREATLIGLDLCAAVAAVHESGLLHRDIKTKNVMREEGGRIVLMDFGLSQDMMRASLTDSSSGEVCGTPVYMAPEVLRREKASVQSDIYSMGVLLYHLVTGTYPAEARNLDGVRKVHARGGVKLLRERRADLPEPFVRVVDVALSAEPDMRFAAAERMFRALDEALDFEVPKSASG
jgi:serine/threonine protein kinase